MTEAKRLICLAPRRTAELARHKLRNKSASPSISLRCRIREYFQIGGVIRRFEFTAI